MKRLPLFMVTLVLLLAPSATALATRPQLQVSEDQDRPLPITIRPGNSGMMGVSPAGQSNIPVVLSVSPANVSQGQSGNIILIGQNLSSNMRIILGDGITTGTPSLLNDIGASATLPISVSADATPGQRILRFQYRDQVHQSQARITVSGTSTKPAVRTIVPNTLQRGQHYDLTLTGVRLEGVSAVNFGAGITSESPVAENNRLRVSVQVAANAQPGAHMVTLVDAAGSHTASVAVTVAGGDSLVLDSPLTFNPDQPFKRKTSSPFSVQALLPNQWSQGKTYQIEVIGRNFSEGLEADLGDGIKIEDFSVVSSGKLTMTVKVASSAAAGSRSLMLRSAASQPWNPFPAKAWVVARKLLSKPKPKLAAPDIKVQIKGRIELLDPGDYLKSNSLLPETLNEQTVFTWREKNPGLADWFEWRLVTENGYVIEKQRIDPDIFKIGGQDIKQLPTAFRMDTAYLLDLLTKDRKTHENTVNHGLGGLILWWEVAGFKTYLTTQTTSTSSNMGSGVQFVQNTIVPKNVEVEISDRRSLCTPRKPTGLACAGSAASASAIHIVNPDKGNRAANYPGDRWELTGTLNLRDIPYAMQESVASYSPGDYSLYIANVFLDWGDGSGVTNVEIDLSKPAPLDLIPVGKKYFHRYERSGNYTVRIFVLPSDDIQGGAPDALASVYDEVYGNTQASAGPVVLSSSSYNPYFKAIKGIQKTGAKDFQVSGLGKPSFEFNENSYYAMAGRAHLIYCETKKIAFREDLVAQGPLHLESIAITGINGSGSTQQTIPMPSKGKTTISLPNNKKTIPKKPSKSNNGSSPSSNSAGQIGNLAASQASANAAGMVQTGPGMGAAAQAILDSIFDGQVSACDILQGNAGLTYYGEGTARITWRLKQGNSSMIIGSVEKDLASPLRTEQGVILTESTQNTPTPESFATEPLNSPVVEMADEMANKAYSLVVEAEVLPQVSHMSQEVLFNLLEAAQGSSAYALGGDSGYAFNPFSWLVAEAHAAPAVVSTDQHLNAFQKSGVKMSILAPSKEGISGRPVMVSLNQFAEAKKYPAFEQKKEKPYYVKSEPFDYRVTASDPAKPCKFLFPTSTGEHFEIRNLEVTETGGKFSGNGVLNLGLYTGQGGSATHYILPIAIHNWSVAADGSTVTSGSINHSLDYTVNEAGMRMQLKKLAGRAGQTPMNLTLNARTGDPDLHLTGSSQPPEWTVTGPVSEAGDWYYSEAANMEIEIGNSGFSIKPQEIVLDLSASQGMAANPNGAGMEWAGLHFGENAQLIPNLFEFQVPEANKGRVSNWGIEGTRLVGKTEITAPFSTPYKEGTIGFSSISVDTGKSNLAIYRNLDVDLPWLETHLKGDARLVHGVPGQEAFFDFSAISQSEVVKEYRGITMMVRDLLFGNFPQAGWAARADSTTFRFEAEDVVFADNVVAAGIIYSMDGRPLLENGSDMEIALGGKSTLGLTPIDLESVRITFHKTGNAVLSFNFATSFSISEVLSSVEVPVRYAINRDGNQYQAEGPYVTPFDLDVSFPAGQPNVEAKVHIEYTGSGLSSSTAAAESSDSWWPFGVTEAHAASGPQDRFNGTLDMKMFDGPPIAAEFRLGYLNGHDYWLMRATLDLGPSGTPFVPPFLKLYKIRGGLGHNFPIDAFKSVESLTFITPALDNSYLFMAGMRVGSSDGFIVTMDGDLTIKIGDGARMDFRAWLLNATHSGNGNFQGYLQYTADGMDGALTGHFGLLNDAIYFDIPENACTLHFGGSEPWHIYAGRKNGPKLRMHLLIRDIDGYMMLDETALSIGGGVYYYLGASIGHIEGTIETGLTITSTPSVSGYGQGGVRAEVCYKKCVSAGISVRVDVSALPVEASARGCVTIPIPFWNPSICRTFSL